MLDKTKNDARGAQINCVNFQLCPFCYGCRNFRSDDMECQECKRLNAKKNICNIEKHKEDIITKMIIKPKIKIQREK